MAEGMVWKAKGSGMKRKRKRGQPCNTPQPADLVAVFDGDSGAVIIAVVTASRSGRCECAYGDVVREVTPDDAVRIHKKRFRSREHGRQFIGQRFESAKAAKAAMKLLPHPEGLKDAA